MSDTPRTDEREARSEGLHDEWAFSLCRQLERELNAANQNQWSRGIHSCHNACARPMCTLRRERDEAIAAINDCVNWANGKEDEWGTRAENSFNFLHRFLAKCKTDQPKL
jgi:hypothetical protein